MPKNPIFAHLGHSNSPPPGELLLGLLAGVGVAQVGIEILIEHLRGLFAEIAPLPPAKGKKNQIIETQNGNKSNYLGFSGGLEPQNGKEIKLFGIQLIATHKYLFYFH